MPADDWGVNTSAAAWFTDEPPPLVDASRGGIPPPAGARFEAGGLFDAFPGHGGMQPPTNSPMGWGAPGIPGRTPYENPASLPLPWQYQPPPHSAPSPWTYGQYQSTPPSWAQTPAQTWGAPTPASDVHWPLTPGSAHARQSPYAHGDGFSSLAWRPPEYDRPEPLDGGWNMRTPHSAPLGGSYFGAAEASTSGQPVAGGDSYFAQQGRGRHERSRSRHGHRPRYEDEIVGDMDGFDGLYRDEVDEMRAARMEMEATRREMEARGRRQREEDTDWDLLDGFQGLSINRSRSRHGRDRSRSRKQKSAMKRSNSLGGGVMHAYDQYERERARYGLGLQGMGLQGTGEQYRLDGFPYNQDDIVRRPRDWRAEYSVKNGLLSKVPGMKHRSDVKEIVDPHRRNAHALLHLVSASAPPLIHDLRLDPRTSLRFPHLPRQPNDLDFAQLACEPPTQHMRLYHTRLPWYVDVYAPRANGVTVWDVVIQLWQSLQTPISTRDFYNEEMAMPLRSASLSGSPGIGLREPPSPGYARRAPGVTGKDEVARAFRERCRLIGQMQGDPPMVGGFGEMEEREIRKGVRRVDWLGMEGRVIWVGLVRGKNGMWEIKTDKVHR